MSLGDRPLMAFPPSVVTMVLPPPFLVRALCSAARMVRIPFRTNALHAVGPSVWCPAWRRSCWWPFMRETKWSRFGVETSPSPASPVTSSGFSFSACWWEGDTRRHLALRASPTSLQSTGTCSKGPDRLQAPLYAVKWTPPDGLRMTGHTYFLKKMTL